jgi:HD superfamily phosphohydrolase YqeK
MGVEELRTLSITDIDTAVIQSLENTIIYVIIKGIIAYRHNQCKKLFIK